MIERWDEADEARRIRSRPRTVGEYFAAEQPLLKPLTTEPFVTTLSDHAVTRFEYSP